MVRLYYRPDGIIGLVEELGPRGARLLTALRPDVRSPASNRAGALLEFLGSGGLRVFAVLGVFDPADELIAGQGDVLPRLQLTSRHPRRSPGTQYDRRAQQARVVRQPSRLISCLFGRQG